MVESSVRSDKEWLVIVNPNAGSRKCGREWPNIQRSLKRLGFEFRSELTTHRGHAITLVADLIPAGYRRIIVVGGDGTLNEVLNGIYSQTEVPSLDFTLAMIPIGTGNDWCRMYGISFDHEKAVQQIWAGRTYIQDCCRVTYHGAEGTEQRMFMNVAGIGYDALVAQKTNLQKEKGKGSPLTYLWFVFEGLFQYRFMDAVIEVDGEIVFKGEIFSMNIGICRYNGGGMRQVPNALPDDGLLDVTLIMKTSKWMVIRHASKLYSGTLVNLPIVKTFQGKEVRIRSTGKIFLEADGESLGHSPFTFGVIPGSVRVIGGELAL